MWVLVGLDGPLKDKQQWLKPGKDYTLGRKGPGVTITGDRTVSREHAIFKVKLCSVNDSTPTAVDVVSFATDASKAPRTDINGKPLGINHTHRLQDGDILQFGRVSSFKVVKHTIVVCLAKANKSQIKDIKDRLAALDWKCTDKWVNGRSTHMWIDPAKQIRATPMEIQCLVSGGTFIDDAWLRQVEAKMDDLEQDFQQMPDAVNYLPSVREIPPGFTVEAWKPNPKRVELFRGLTFIFSDDKLCDHWSPIVINGGGKHDNLSGDACLDTPEELAAKVASYPKPLLVVKYGQGDTSKEEEALHKTTAIAAKRLKSRLIDYKEIFYAVMSISLDKHCNPMAEAPFGSHESCADAAIISTERIKGREDPEVQNTVPALTVEAEAHTAKYESSAVKLEVTDSERRRKRKRAADPLAGFMEELMQDSYPADAVQATVLDADMHVAAEPPSLKKHAKLMSAKGDQINVSFPTLSQQAPQNTGKKRKEIFVTAAMEDAVPLKKRKKEEGIISKEDVLAALKRNPLPNNDASDDEDINEAMNNLRGLLIVKTVDIGRKDQKVPSHYPANEENPRWAGMPNFKRFKKKQPAVSLGERTYIKMIPYNKDYGIGRGLRDDVDVRVASMEKFVHDMPETPLSEATMHEDSDEDEQPDATSQKKGFTSRGHYASNKTKTIRDFYADHGTAATTTANRHDESDDDEKEIQFSWNV